MQLVEKHLINRQHKFRLESDYLAFQSKHFYNCENLVNGRPLKSINQFLNKRVAASQAKKSSIQIKYLNSKRDRRIDNYLHKVSRRVIDWCQSLAGIEVTLTEENDTHKASATDGDRLPIYKIETETKPVFSAKRMQCGLDKTRTGRIINADTNGSMNSEDSVGLTPRPEVLVNA